MEVLAGKLLTREADLNRTPQLEDAARFLARLFGAIKANKYIIFWSASKVCPLLQQFPSQVLHFISSIQNDYSLYSYFLQIPMNQWSRTCSFPFHQFIS